MARGECVPVVVFGPDLVDFLAPGTTLGEVCSTGVLNKEFCGQKEVFLLKKCGLRGFLEVSSFLRKLVCGFGDFCVVLVVEVGGWWWWWWWQPNLV